MGKTRLCREAVLCGEPFYVQLQTDGVYSGQEQESIMGWIGGVDYHLRRDIARIMLYQVRQTWGEKVTLRGKATAGLALFDMLACLGAFKGLRCCGDLCS